MIGLVGPWACAYHHTSFDRNPSSQAVFCGTLFQQIKHSKVSSGMRPMALPSGKANPYLEYVSILVKIKCCPPFRVKGCPQWVLKNGAVSEAQAGQTGRLDIQ